MGQWFTGQVGLRLRGVRGARLREINHSWWLLPLAWVVSPSRMFPRRGIPSLANREVEVKLRSGDVMRAKLNEVLTVFEVFGMNTYDCPEISLEGVRQLVDIGANIGSASLWFARRIPAARLMVVEPMPETFSRLVGNLTRAGVADRVIAINAAVAGQKGTGFMTPGASSTMAHVAEGTAGSGDPVTFIDLSEVLSIVGGSIDLMKFDCEGGEFAFLGQAPVDELQRIGAIVGETHPVSAEKRNALFGHLRAAGFQLRWTMTDEYPAGQVGILAAWREGGPPPTT